MGGGQLSVGFQSGSGHEKEKSWVEVAGWPVMPGIQVVLGGSGPTQRCPPLGDPNVWKGWWPQFAERAYCTQYTLWADSARKAWTSESDA